MKLHQLPETRGRTATAAGYGAVIFDMDGVVTDTASLHAAAWKALFDAVLPALPGPCRVLLTLIGTTGNLLMGAAVKTESGSFCSTGG